MKSFLPKRRFLRFVLLLLLFGRLDFRQVAFLIGALQFHADGVAFLRRGGRIEARSEPGKGTCIVFSLKLAAPEPPPQGA